MRRNETVITGVIVGAGVLYLAGSVGYHLGRAYRDVPRDVSHEVMAVPPWYPLQPILLDRLHLTDWGGFTPSGGATPDAKPVKTSRVRRCDWCAAGYFEAQ